MRVLSVCPAGVTGAGMYHERSVAAAASPSQTRASSWLMEVPLEGLVRATLAQLKLGAPSALVPLTLLPMRLAAAAQQLAPDWATAAFTAVRIRGNPFAAAAAEARAQQPSRTKRAALPKKEE